MLHGLCRLPRCNSAGERGARGALVGRSGGLMMVQKGLSVRTPRPAKQKVRQRGEGIKKRTPPSRER